MRLLPLLLVVGCHAAPAPVEPADQQLRPIREAVQARPLPPGERGVLLEGERSSARGDRAPIELWSGPGGACALTVGQGASASRRGFDGREAWVADARGVSRPLHLGSRADLVMDLWLRTQQWVLDPRAAERWEAADGAEGLRFRRAGEGPHPEVIVEVDAVTRRPRRAVLVRNGRERVLTFTDWEERDGLALPMTITESAGGEVVRVDRFASRRRPPGSPARRPASSPSDAVHRAEGGPLPREEVRFDRGGRAFVRVELPAGRKAWMLLDTGFGSHAISRTLAEELSLTASSTVALRGVSGAQAARRLRCERLDVGTLTLRSCELVELDTGFLSERAGFTVGGVLGAPLFQRAVVVIDGIRGRVEVRDPARFDGGAEAWQPVLLDGTAPCVAGQVRASGEVTPPLWFRLDTGSDDTLTVSRWAVQAFGLAGDRTGLAPRSLAGPFGEVRGWRKSADALLVADSALGRQQVTLMRDDAPGPLSDPWIAGNVGTRLLRERRVVLDLGAQRIALESDDGR